MTATRTVKIGKCTVVINDVPDGVTEDQLKSMAMMKLFQMSKDKAKKEIEGFGVAS